MLPRNNASVSAAAPRGRLLDAGTVFLVALALRLGMVAASPGGLTGVVGYDPGVYYTASDALLHGRLPYTDFVFLHPPGIMLALAPFALVGSWWGDDVGYVAANVGFEVLGAVNAVLVLVILRRWGLGRQAALLGGLFAALWLGAARAETAARLEPLGTVLFLAAVLVLAAPANRWRLAGAGALLGAATMVKIWWVVPALVLVGWTAHKFGIRRAAAHLAGTAGGALLIGAPFLLAAPGAMVRMTVADQLGRPNRHALAERVEQFTGVRLALPHLSATPSLVVALLVFGLFVAAAVTAFPVPPARPVVTVMIAQIVVLAVSPSYFDFYNGYASGALALTVGAAAARITTGARRPARRPALLAVVTMSIAAAVTALTVFTQPQRISAGFPTAALRAELLGVRCLASNSPAAAIELDVLSQDLDAGCPDPVDFSGSLLDTKYGDTLGFSRNAEWQRRALRYLRAGDAVVLDPTAMNLSAAIRRAIRRGPLLSHAGGYELRSVAR